jgi:formylmethanofuran dehydrogenase subunit D
MKSKSLKVNLITGRSLVQGRLKEQGKLSEDYLNNVACCELNQDDLNALGITKGQNIKISTDFGSVIVKASLGTQALEKGMAFMPYGPWAEFLVDPKTHGTGMPTYKGINATIFPAMKEKVLTIKEIVEIIRSK